MNLQSFTQNLITASKKERRKLLIENLEICDEEFAKALQQICYEIWTSEPQKVSAIVAVLREAFELTRNKLLEAYAEWTEAIENLVGGRLETCIHFLDDSEKSFQKLNKTHEAATTQTSKLYALALLGRYDEAIECGLRARDIFLAHNDVYSAGKIENNIGNLYWRRDFYRESEPFLESARARFLQIDDQRQLAMVENCQAFVKALQNQFREAETIYRSALNRAKENNLTVTEAEIETGMSNLYLFQGRFELALKFMESSRQKYDLLQIPQQTANCELEIADIYLELNLVPEAVEFYRKTDAKFAELGMQAERARSLQNHAKVLFLLNETEKARQLAEASERISRAEGNRIAAAAAKLTKATILFREKGFDEAQRETEAALQIFEEGGNLRYELSAKRLLGEIFAARNETVQAIEVLEKTLAEARENSLQIAYLCLVSLGRLKDSEEYFLQAVEIVENSRSALSAEEFRTAFLADKITVYNELVKMSLRRNELKKAFSRHERSRSRSLLDSINFADNDFLQSDKLRNLRNELNWFYNRINRESASGLEARTTVNELRREAAEREKQYAELFRREKINGKNPLGGHHKFELKDLQKTLKDANLIEFLILDGKFAAFVVGENRFEFVPELADEEILKTEVKQFLFQIKTARFQDKLTQENRRTAFARLMRHAQKIYEMMIRPLEKFIDREKTVIIPAGILHYLPFQALHDGERFFVETKQISYAPSASIWQNLQENEIFSPKTALLVGVADKFTPNVKTEIEVLSKLFEETEILADEKATLENLSKKIHNSDVLHLACHGKFRPDNPSFSSLGLFNENLTVKDAQTLNLKGRAVVLSACETGLNNVVSGEELVGLASGFLAAGASSLIMSLWTVNDAATLEMMKNFYALLLKGNGAAKSLQSAQLRLLEKNPHPYFWSPFVLTGN
ncbi:MAG: CHAT domain-containing protein [Pyrinomonadaceae bacterium]|nr:CHAT domain-containing protein [Pyrinomonadaceae bacterium]